MENRDILMLRHHPMNVSFAKDVSSVPPEGFRPFYGSTFIALYRSVPKTGFINCIVPED